MRASTLTRLALATGLFSLGSAGCRSTTPAAEPTKPAARPYMTASGGVDYAALRRKFGAPNENLVLNPKAVNVADTTSRNSVTVTDSSLVFAGPGSAWLERLGPGYTLYCNSACGRAFIRNILAVARQNDDWVVTTELGGVPDVVETGWLHADVPVKDLKTHKNPRLTWNKTFTLPTASKSGSVQMPSPVTGSLTGAVAFASTIAIDIVTSGFHLQTVSIIGTGTPSFDATLDATASASYKQDWQMFSASYPLGEIQLGPVPVLPTLALKGTAHAEASGSVNLHGTAHADVAMTAGFTWDATNGAAPNTGWVPTFTQSLVLSGKANAKAYIQVEADLQFQVAGVAGPEVDVISQLGAEASANFTLGEASSGDQCNADIQGDVFLNVNGQAGVNLTIPHFSSIQKTIPFANQNFIIQSYDFPQPDFCGLDAGSGSAGNNGSSTSAGNGGGTTSGGNGGGTTGGSTCPSGQSDCGDGQGCHDLSVDPVNCGSCDAPSTPASCATITGSSASSCSGGACQCVCPDGMTACPNGQTSDSCTATTTCSAGMADCDQTGQCATATDSDPNNCGGCAISCGSGICAGGQCLCSDNVTVCDDPTCASCPAATVTCPTGMLDCDGSGQCATDGTMDPNNCGGCSNMDSSFSCQQTTGSSTSTCSGGTCQCLCDDGSTACPDGMNASSCTTQCGAGTADCAGDGTCSTDITSDPSNCGGCNQPCASGSCVNQQCACAGGAVPCPDGSCANPDTQSDSTHCGATCGDCTAQTGSDTSQCQAGSCVCLCSDGVTACPDGQSAGSCNQGTTCPDGQQDCDGTGQCNDLTSDPNNCSQCGNPCSTGFCVNSTCACDSNGTVSCNNACPDYTSDPQNCGSCGNDCTQAVGDGNTGPEATCQGSACSCGCTCSNTGAACPNCDSTQC